MIKLKEFASGRTLGDRDKAMLIRSSILNELIIPENKVVIDFGGELVITQSFMDELIGALVMDEGKEILSRFEFQNISEKNKSILKFVVKVRMQNQLN